ncbi:hypothetical protein ACFLXL_01400 [Chloroflexota bacterium]
MLEVSRYEETEDLVFTPIYGITDVVEGKTFTLDELEKDLTGQIANSEWVRQDKIADKDLSESTLATISKYVKGWGVEKNGDNTYSISGFGMGWKDGLLIEGQWIFTPDTGEVVAAEKEGIDLSYILLAE